MDVISLIGVRSGDSNLPFRKSPVGECAGRPIEILHQSGACDLDFPMTLCGDWRQIAEALISTRGGPIRQEGTTRRVCFVASDCGRVSVLRLDTQQNDELAYWRI